MEMTVESDDGVCRLIVEPWHRGSMCALPNSKLQTTCSGDSGGPLFYYVGQSIIQIGILSRGYTSECKLGTGSVFVRVPYYLDWIEKNMK